MFQAASSLNLASTVELAKLKPGLFNIKPVITEEPSVEELDGELRKIAEDVVNAAKYSITAVAADSNVDVRPDTLESDFKLALKSVKPELQRKVQTQAVELVKAPEAVRATVFGRYGQLPADMVIKEGFSRIGDRLKPLKVNAKLLGLDTPQITMPLSGLQTIEQGILLPQTNLSRDVRDLESAAVAANQRASETGVFDMERFEQVWGQVHENDIFSTVDSGSMSPY